MSAPSKLELRRAADRRIRPGDLVRVLDPRRVLRVGYPRCVADYMPDLRLRALEPLEKLVESLGVPLRAPKLRLAEEIATQRGFTERVLREVALLKLRIDGFGGRERSIHLSEPVEELRGQVARAVSVRSAVTGTYCPGRAGRGCTPNGHDEDDPPLLDNAKTHRLVLIDASYANPPGSSIHYCDAEFPAAHLEKIHPCKVCLGKGKPVRDCLHPLFIGDGRCSACETPFEAVS